MLSADSFLDENESTGKIYFTINSKCSPYIIICDTSNEVIRIAKVLWGCKSVSIYEGFHIRIDGTGLTLIVTEKSVENRKQYKKEMKY